LLPGNKLLPVGGNRRDSNTSTISSYLSSMRSDTSPFPLSSHFSSRRSSEVSQISNRLSITNSPYEYDITGNIPIHGPGIQINSRRSSETSNMSDIAAQLQKAQLGSHPNLVVQSQAMTLRSPSSKYANERVARFLSARHDLDGARTSTPCRTPLPHELPNREIRRASDPVRTLDPNFSVLKKLQRFHSLNMMKPLPVPQSMKSLINKTGSNNTFHSSHSSIATDYSLAENDEYGSPGRTDADHEAALEEQLMADNEDMIIPDDMQRFLNECYNYGVPSSIQEMEALQENEIQNEAGQDSNKFSKQQMQMNEGNNNNNMQMSPGYYGNQGVNHNSVNYMNNTQMQNNNMQMNQMWNQDQGYNMQNMSQGHNMHNNTAMHNPMPPNSSSNMMPPNSSGNMMPQNMSGNMMSPNSSGNMMPQNMSENVMPPNSSGNMMPQNMSGNIMPPNSSGNIMPQNSSGNIMPQNSSNNMMPPPSSNMIPHPPSGNKPMQHSMQTGQMTDVQMMNMGNANMSYRMNGANNRNFSSGQQVGMNQWQMMQGGMNGGNNTQFIQDRGPQPPNMPKSQQRMNMRRMQALQQAMTSNQNNMQNQQMGGYQSMNNSQMSGGQGSNNMQMPGGQNMNMQMTAGQNMNNMQMPGGQGMNNMQMQGQNMNTEPLMNQMQPGLMLPPQPPLNKRESQSPQVQVPHISTSQIPARGKAANRNQMMMQQPNEMLTNQTNCNNMLPANQNNCNNQEMYHQMQGNFNRQKMPQNFNQGNNTVFPPSNMYNQNPPNPQQMWNQQNINPRMPNNQQYSNQMEMSPGCNQVTSSTDREDSAQPIEDFMENINSISSENLLDNMSSVSEHTCTNNFVPPGGNRSESQSSRYSMMSNNMVVNDMSSVLTQLAQENKYLNMRH